MKIVSFLHNNNRKKEGVGKRTFVRHENEGWTTS
jgi:hypothetical protein